MTNKKRGYIDIKVGNKNRTLHFSMNFWSEFTEQLGISLADIGGAFQNGISIKGLRALVYSAILANDQENGNEIDYNLFTVGAWLDELDAEKINEIVEVMLQSKILGNSLNGETETKGKRQPSKKK
jgi:hypothetical protein|tara:strand:+ start:234 stop:611 length:378 start_codon:yes stop_codon:yes gene_type:complete